MSYQNLLQTITDKPIFDIQNGILSAPVRHVFMIGTVWFLTQQHGNSENFRVLEVGSWYGASALSWAQGIKNYNRSQGTITCVDAWTTFFDRTLHPEEFYTSMENALSSDLVYNIFLHNIKTIPHTIVSQHIRGKSDTVLPILKNNFFDVAFLDGDHSYNAVKNDIKNATDLVKEGGIICGDDLNLQLHECDLATAKSKSDYDVAKDPKTGRNFHPGVTLAVGELFGEVSAWGGFWAMQKKNNQWQKISLKTMPICYPEHFPEEALKRAQDHFNDLVLL